MVNVLQFRRRMSMQIAAEAYATLQARPINSEIICRFLHTINEQKLVLLCNAMRMFPMVVFVAYGRFRVLANDCSSL